MNLRNRKILTLGLLGIAAMLPTVATAAANLSNAQASQYALHTPATAPGQSATLLPDGTWLLLGGVVNGQVTGTAIIKDAATGQATLLSAGLSIARAWHTATLLPNGRVFIFGGVGANGQLISQAEYFDPTTKRFSLAPTTGLPPRSHHTANVLTSGLVLFTGGAEFATAELWDPRTNQITDASNAMVVPRADALSALLPTSPVLIWGGTDITGAPLSSAELYVPSLDQFAPAESGSALLPAPPDIAAAPSVAESIPSDGATEVAVSAEIAVRFSERLKVTSLNSATVTLIGPAGQVAATVVPAEAGMLLFVTPEQQLLPASYYTLFIRGASDPQGNALPLVTLGFETAALSAGATSGVTASSSGTGTISVIQSPLPLGVGVWQPTSADYGGNWLLGPATKSPQANVPMLQAAPGVTALSGQVLLQNGAPLQGVSVSIGNQQTITDAAGRFLVADIPAGHVEFIVNGRTANSTVVQYGQFVIGADISPAVTNTLNYSVWMPVIDTAHAVNIPSPTTQEVDITSPLMPGVVLKIPAGVVIREPNGKIVTQVSLTPVPIDRTPFPMPAPTPIYFVMQPGGATLESVTGDQRPGMQIIYPNMSNQPPGTYVPFWNYDPSGPGWTAYGHGRVSASGDKIVPDSDVHVYSFTADYAGQPGIPPPPQANPPIDGCECGDPVDPYTGVFQFKHVDMVVPDTIPIVIQRTYQSSDTVPRQFGMAMSNGYYNMYLYDQYGPDDNNFVTLLLVLPNGSTILYTRVAGSPPMGLFGLQMTVGTSPSAFYGSTITYDSNNDLFVLTLKDGTEYKFDNNDGRYLTEIVNRNGQTLQFMSAVGVMPDGRPISQIISPTGRSVSYQYASTTYPGNCCEVSTITDDSGRSVSYAYDSSNRLIKVTYPDGGVEQYTYNGSTNEIQSVVLPNGQTQVTNTYDANGRVIQQTLAGGGSYTYLYTTSSSTGEVVQTTVTDPNGNVTVLNFNNYGYVTSEVQASGTAVQQTTSYTRNPLTNLVTSSTDALNRTTNYSYDNVGNLTAVTLLAGTSNAVTYNFTYTPTFNELATVSDPLNHKTTFGYDSLGDLTSLSDPLGHRVTMAYNTAMGLPTKFTDALGHAITLGYTGSDLTSITDALGRTTMRNVDVLGRVVSTVDPLGNVTAYTYDPMDRVTSITEPNGAVTAMSYDPDGNLKSITDANNHVTDYTYNTSDRLISRTDALNQTETFSYDLDNNLTSHTDRKSQSQVLSYDALNRLTQVTYKTTGGSTESTVNYGYDAGDRVTSVNDSAGGMLTESYDGLDRLTSEVSPTGSVSYQYDAASRRTQMTVAGQGAVNYGYDNANRLTTITQGGSSVSVAYDNANRRTTLTLPNGIKLSYGFDNANELTGLTYKLGSTTVGSLTYGYNNDGEIVSRGGTFDVTNLPAAVASAVYDADNRLTNWGSQTLSYDADGNLTGDGTNTYTWDTRNQLMSLSGGSTGSFVYDGVGRRESKTINGTATNFLYDGMNLEQELSGTTPTVNYLTGAGMDEVFSRSTSSGTQSYLTDNLGSTLALTSSAGAIQTGYSYEPYGNTTATGSASTNALQYTGRENDGDGLYYNRARYYSPTYGRFISSDPIGLRGGVNTYAYVLDDPLSFDDPFGLDLHIGVYQGAYGFGHIAIGVNQTPMVGAFPAHQSPSLPFADAWVPAAIRQDTNPIDTITIHTTADQDKLVQEYIAAVSRNPGLYNLYSNSCVDFVRGALEVADLPVGNAMTPAQLFSDIMQRYSPQQYLQEQINLQNMQSQYHP